MTLPPGMSSEDYIALSKANTPHFHRMICAQDESAFYTAVEAALRHALRLLEDRRKLLCDDGEVKLSTRLADYLTMAGLHTTAEEFVNGHVDVVVKHAELGKFRMLGECKLHKTPAYHCAGTTQVLGYASGAEKRVFCLDFCRHANVKERVDKLRQHFGADRACHEVASVADHPLPWSFLAVHVHTSKQHVEVLHIVCNLHVPGTEPTALTDDEE